MAESRVASTKRTRRRIALDLALVLLPAAGLVFLNGGLGPTCSPWPLTAALLIPIFVSERRLALHVRSHQAAIEERAELLSGERELAALTVGERGHAARALGALGLQALVFPISLVALALATSDKLPNALGLGAWTGPNSVFAGVASWAPELGLLQLVFAVPLAGYLHLLRRAVYRHEGLVRRALEPASEARDERTHAADQDWNERYRTDVLVTLGSLVPLLGAPFLPWLVERVFGTIAAHEEHEGA